MRLLALLALVLVACDYRDPLDPTLACETLDVQLVERSVSPPANVAALVRVTDCKGAPLGYRLEPDAFELYENGRLLSPYEASRQIIPAERQRAQRTLVALDLSGSVLRSGMRTPMIEGARRLVELRGEDQELAIFGFDGRSDLIPFTYFTADHHALMDALTRADAAPLVDDSTNLNGAVLAGLEILDRAVEIDARDIYTVAHGSLVIFTDGQDLAGRASDEAVAAALGATPHASFAIGVGEGTDDLELARIGRTGHLHTSDVDGIAQAFADVAGRLAARAEANYVVSYCSPARAGKRALRIAVRAPDMVGAIALDFDATGFGAGCSPSGTILR